MNIDVIFNAVLADITKDPVLNAMETMLLDGHAERGMFVWKACSISKVCITTNMFRLCNFLSPTGNVAVQTCCELGILGRDLICRRNYLKRCVRTTKQRSS
jgi:hypothetical protein